MDTLLASQPAAAGVSPILILAVWAAAIIAAVVATVRRARGAGELRDQLRELERKLAAPSPPMRPNPARATPSFGATFYQATPSPLDGLLAWPGAVPTLLAAVLALGGAGLMVSGASSHTDGGTGYRQQLIGLQASHDSLTVMLKDLRDSLRVLAAAPVARKQAATSAEPTRPLATALRSSVPPSAGIPRAPAAPAVLPAAPALEAGASSAIPKAPALP